MAFRLYEDDDHAKLYSKFRPTYPKDLIDFIVTYCKEKINQSTNSPSSLAVDIGCGPGQSTRLFADHFDKVIGFDISEAQINEVRPWRPKGQALYIILERNSTCVF